MSKITRDSTLVDCQACIEEMAKRVERKLQRKAFCKLCGGRGRITGPALITPANPGRECSQCRGTGLVVE